MNKIQTALAVAGLVLASSGANAALVTKSGLTVDFTFDTDAANNVVDNTLVISQGFDVFQSSEGLDLTWPPILSPFVNITAKSGYSLEKITAKIFGKYIQLGDAAVDAYAELTVNDPLGYTTPLWVSDLSGSISGWNAEAEYWLQTGTTTAAAQVETILFANNFGGTSLAAINVSRIEFAIDTAVTAVPVPGAFWLFGSALTGVLVTRRRLAA
jgi:hypothetical protein